MELVIDQVSKSYGSKQVLKEISLRLEPGVLGLLGPNGAGKSTLMRILSTIEKTDSGTVRWKGEEIEKHPNSLRSQLGYLPQDFGIYPNMTAMEFLQYIAAIKGLEAKSANKRIQEILEALNLANDRKRPLGGFSGGMKQRVGIAQALLNDPELLIVDEPTVGLDPEERIRFRNLLSSLSSDRIIILSTHIVSDIEAVASKVAILSQGCLLENTTPEGLMKAADHKVWERVVTTEEFSTVQKEWVVSSAVHRSSGIHARIISDEKPGSEAVSTTATLEDAYLYHLSFLKE